MKGKKKIAFIGAGNMGEALIRGIIAARLFSPDEIMASEPREKRRRQISRQLRIRVTSKNRPAVRFADVVVLAVKPQSFAAVVKEVAAEIRAGQLVISIMAGISSDLLEEKLPKNVPVVRVMPNTPALVRSGVAAICPGKFARREHLHQAEKILGAVGMVVRIPEELMNLVTAVSGCGPAYVYLLAEALAEAARQSGIRPELADILARETVIGAAKLLEKSGESAASLRQKVTSPGGMTEAALRVLEAKKIRGLIKAAVAAARRRGEELGKVG